MPFGDGTGPTGAGSGTGRGRGGGRRQTPRAGGGRGRMGGFAAGPGGNCICPACNAKAPHQRGVPCNTLKCPECGGPMTREI